MAQNKKQKTEYKTLLSVLANGSTDKAVALLKKHSGESASDTKDLEMKLARAYALSTSKRDIEKEFAEIHPHKDFILKYLQPKVEVAPLKPDALVTPETKAEKVNVTESVMVHDGYSSANGHAPCGNPNCTKCSRYFNCSGGGDKNCAPFSNASGEQTLQSNNQLAVVGIVAVVGIISMMLYLKSNK